MKYIDLDRIEFVITDICSGRCKHCSNSESSSSSKCVDAVAATAAVQQLTQRFAIRSIMTFGGEPLLYPDTVCRIHAAARDSGIPERQLITNGFFSKDEEQIDTVAKTLCDSGVTDILVSVDVFHQEFIPIEPVTRFAEALRKYNVSSLQIQPAWVVNEQDENPYNTETKRLLQAFTDKGFRINEGNNVFPSGNALRYLSAYFAPPENIDLSIPCGSAPYTTRLDAINCFGINPNGGVSLCSITIGNIHDDDILNIVDRYNPHNIPADCIGQQCSV